MPQHARRQHEATVDNTLCKQSQQHHHHSSHSNSCMQATPPSTSLMHLQVFARINMISFIMLSLLVLANAIPFASSNTAPVGWNPGLQDVQNLGHISNFGSALQDYLKKKQQRAQRDGNKAGLAESSDELMGEQEIDDDPSRGHQQPHQLRPTLSPTMTRQGKVAAIADADESDTPRKRLDESPFGPIVPLNSTDYQHDFRCHFYNKTLCAQSRGGEGCGESAIVCNSHAASSDSPGLCYALWSNTTEGVVVTFKGCWIGQASTCSSPNDECLETGSPKTHLSLLFCCCARPLCNGQVQHIPPHKPSHARGAPRGAFLGEDQHSDGQAASKAGYDEPLSAQRLGFTLALLLAGLVFLAGVLLAIGYLYRDCRHKPSHDSPTSEPLLDSHANATGYIGTNPIQLKEIRAQGKFGSVWQATDGGGNMVAVKVFAVNDRNSWQIEKDVYSLPQMKHKNILMYLGAERRGEGVQSEFWLITEYHPNGSLYDYLKSCTLNWKQLLTIVHGIGLGLRHLHEELPASGGERAKPSIAHRDFKSKNVLISTNFRACIADFGLALVFHSNGTSGDAHGQVGTRRYMAPEVLEGAINFNRDSFLRIDMYAAGLVLWEIMSRTSSGEITCDEYRLPFEEEIGQHPSVEDMQEAVAQQKKRPKMKDAFFKHPGMKIVANTAMDCWDQDAEARISASTICERLQSIITNEDNCLTSSTAHNTSGTNYRVAYNAASNHVTANGGGGGGGNAALFVNHNGSVANGQACIITSTPASSNTLMHQETNPT